ncbi:MAG: type II secretion system F family protein [Planctomycetaceae bacterium]
MFAPRASMKQLALLSRSLGVGLQAGVPIIKVIETSSRKSSDSRLRRVMGEVVDDIKSGATVTDAVDAHGAYFPDLFVDMLAVGEQTGSLPEVLLALSDHYENNVRLRKEFFGQILWPMIQLTAAVLIIALMIYVLGWISGKNANSGVDTDVLGWGLMGARGAAIWLGGWAAAGVLLWFGYRLMMVSLAGRRTFYRLLMGVPVLGGCLRNFAIARFAWAFHLTQSAGMPIDDSLDASLRATGNGAYDAASPAVNRAIRAGETLSDGLQETGLFPEDFINIVHISETSGTVPETLQRLSPQFEEDARRSLSTLTTIAGWLVWLLVAGFIIYVIFKIVLWYTGLINSFLP